MTSNDIFLGGGSNSGQFVEQSLPNIKGSLEGIQSSNKYRISPFGFAEGTKGNLWNTDGCIETYTSSSGTNNTHGINGNNYNGGVNSWRINANLSNSIYKDNSNVTPKHYTVEFWIKFK